MDVIATLKQERERLRGDLEKIDAAIEILSGQMTHATNGASRPKTAGRHISAAGRRRLSEMMKRRWAERRKAKAGTKRAATK